MHQTFSQRSVGVMSEAETRGVLVHIIMVKMFVLGISVQYACVPNKCNIYFLILMEKKTELRDVITELCCPPSQFSFRILQFRILVYIFTLL